MRLRCVILLFLSYGITSECALVDKTENVTEYLNRRMREAKVEIVKSYIESHTRRVIPSSYNTTWTNLWRESFDSERALTLSMWNKMFVLVGNRVLSIDVESAGTEDGFRLHEVAYIKPKRSVKFVKSIVYKSTAYLLVCYDDASPSCSFHTGKIDLKLKHRQIIRHKGRPVDATWFSLDSRLYLVVAYSSDSFPVPSIIYHWTGTYMDIIEEITMVGAVSVTTFNSRASAIIVFGQNEKSQPNIGSGVYKFDDRDGLEKKQYLPTNGPTSIRHYFHGRDFLLATNERAPSNLYGWDGNEFIPWFDFVEMASPKLVKFVPRQDETLYFVMYETHVALYSVTSYSYARLDLLKLENDERIVDMSVWFKESSTLTLILVTFDGASNLYRIETFELRITKIDKNARINDGEGSAEKCLTELHEKLNDRMKPIESIARRVWPTLVSSAKNITADELGNKLDRLVVRSGSIGRLDVSTKSEILLSNEMKALAASEDSPGSKNVIDSILDESRKTVRINEDNRLVGKIIIRNNATFEGFHTNAIETEFLNGVPARLDNTVISATKNQTFPQSVLRGENITIRNLEIDQLCGLSREYWLKDKKRNEIFVNNNEIRIINDSVHVRTDLLSFEQLELNTLENVDLTDFFSDLFIIDERQIIRGNIIKQSGATLSVNNLVIEELNGVPTSDLITREKNQRFGNAVFVKTMSIENLIVDKVNGVAVAECAMVSKKNHIAGQVTIATLRVLEELAIASSATTITKVRPVQVYDNVTLVGRITASNLAFDGPRTHFALSARNNSTIGTQRIFSIESIVKSHWTRSTEQTIKNPVTFDAGLSIDRLTVKYLNSLDIENDLLFTGDKEISPTSGSLAFENLIVHGSLIEAAPEDAEAATSELSAGPNKLYELTDDALYFNQELRIERFGVEHLSIKSFNGIPIDEIMKRRDDPDAKPYEYGSDTIQRFDSVTVNDRLEVERIDLRYVNDADELPLDSLLRYDADYKLERLENSTELTLGGDVTFVDGVSSFIKESADSTIDENTPLIIDGDLLIDGDLRVFSINDKTTANYLDYLSSRDIVIDSDNLIIDELIVQRDFQLNSIHDLHIESLPMKTFSKSRRQNFTDSRFTFFKVSADRLQADWINDCYTRDLVYTDAYNISFNGNVTFTNLRVSLDDDVQTRYLNGYRLEELYEKLATIDRSVVDELTVSGNIFWESQSSSIESNQIGPLETIMRNALVRGTSDASPLQTIRGETRIESSVYEISQVSAGHMKYRSNQLNGIDLGEIVNESVLDDSYKGNEIKIVGRTTFGEDLKTTRLDVDGAIGIDALNTWRIDDLKSSILVTDSLNGSSIDSNSESPSSSIGRPPRRYDRQGRTMIFAQDTTVEKLTIRTGNGDDFEPRLHGVPISAIALSSSDDPNGRMLPNNAYFAHLEVHNDIFVESLDSVNFDEFVNDRVTLSMNHEVRGNIKFNGRVEVTGAATVGKINGVDPADLAINYSHEDQIITGDKIFHGDIVTYGKTYAPRIAGIDFKEEHGNAVFNHEPVDIYGDIIFEANVETATKYENGDGPTGWKLSENSFVNGMRLSSLTNDRDSHEETFFRTLISNESLLEESVSRAASAMNNLPEMFYYFETEENLTISVASVDRVEYIRAEDLTILNMYASQPGSNCGLADECPCRKQYVAEISSRDCQIYPVDEPRRIVYNFHPANEAFGISVTTTSVSSSERCTNNETLPSEFTTISWMKIAVDAHGKTLGGRVTQEGLEIYGYLSDVQVFTHNGLVFIVLAIYYDPIEATHQTNSLIYALDLANDDITLVQRVPTSHATGLEVFKIPGKGVHILFAGLAARDHEQATSESLLYRFRADRLTFELLRSFTSGGNRHAQSVTQAKDEFLLLDDAATNSINVYIYDGKTENFYYHQSLYLDSAAPITSVEAFYTGEYRYGQVYIVVTTKHDQLFVYEYMFIGGFQLISQKRVNGILSMIPFDVSGRRYMLLGTDADSTVLRIVEQGRH